MAGFVEIDAVLLEDGVAGVGLALPPDGTVLRVDYVEDRLAARIRGYVEKAVVAEHQGWGNDGDVILYGACHVALSTHHDRALPCGGITGIVRTAQVEVQRTDVDARSHGMKLLQLAAGACSLSQPRDKQGPQHDGVAMGCFHGLIVLVSHGIVASGRAVSLGLC